ncbi:hypothetical protein AKJ09_03527 [Labilithrix luteola]|uniref:Uncharacterized protein n=1 Tax=Labilithrix luteola TaxID=1391654 RepID=A0A0K1PTK1_9BACT|nr:Uma2 family endonuclease [Labilithrix luteola]AKU96863.1 hypothetical protein AKJ09_03527 [Labilithrix luteola]
MAQAAGENASVGCDQFLYFDPTNASRKCAPDATLKLGVRKGLFDVWKTWEAGAPDLCVEILCKEAEEKLTLDEKLARFHEMGVPEVVAFNADAPPGRRIRAWDFVSGDLVERVVEHDATPSLSLNLWFVVGPGESDDVPFTLRLAEDSDGQRLVPTPLERERAEKLRAFDERDAERREKERALAELAALRAQLGERRS